MTVQDSAIRPEKIGVIVVDHGSRRADSNGMLLEVVRVFERSTRFQIVEPAHMELAEPSISTAFDRCVERGARLVVVHPYFLLPGRHWDQDIPKLVAHAAARHRGVGHLVTAPLGLHPLLAEIINERIESCLRHAIDVAPPCDLCTGTDKCQVRSEQTGD